MKIKVKTVSLIVFMFMVFSAGIFFINESNAQSKKYKIGDKGPAGGWIFYDKGDFKDGWRYLEAAPVDQSKGAEWGCQEKSIPEAKGTDIGTGKSNTQAIVKNCEEANIAAKLCTTYHGGGKRDWFLPSKKELNLMHETLNVNGIGGFSINDSFLMYWNSSEYSVSDAWCQLFSYGIGDKQKKSSSFHVRAIRAF